MVKLYNGVGQTYMRGYGHIPVVYKQDGYGMLQAIPLMEQAKNLTQTSMPILAKTFKQIPAPIADIGRDVVDLGGEVVNDLKESGSRISKEAEKLLRKMSSKTKKTKKLKAKVMEIPKALSKNLSSKQKSVLNKMAQDTLGKLLKKGSGLKIM